MFRSYRVILCPPKGGLAGNFVWPTLAARLERHVLIKRHVFPGFIMASLCGSLESFSH